MVCPQRTHVVDAHYPEIDELGSQSRGSRPMGVKWASNEMGVGSFLHSSPK